MTPQEFIAAMEQQMAKQAGGGMGALIPAAARGAAQQAAQQAAPSMLQRGLNAAGRGVGIAADESLTALNNLGAATRHGAGKVVDAGKDFVNGFRGKGAPAPDGTPRLTGPNPGTGMIPSRRADNFALPVRPAPRTWGNIGTGAAVAGGTAAGLTSLKNKLFYGNGQDAVAPMPYPVQHSPAQGGGGLMDMWNNLPLEARYAIGAGVPLALMGAFAHGGGNSGLGMGLGAAGLGLAGLGAAHGGYLGKNMQGGAQSIMDMLNGRGGINGGQDPHYHAYLQGQLNNNLENNSVRGVKKSSDLQAFGAALEKLSAGRCWTGYEPVPGKAPYSNDSCRPKGKKATKKKTEEKTAAKDCGCTSMTETPSSRGTLKKINDEQKSTNSPQPEDVGMTQQKMSQAYLFGNAIGKEAGFMGDAARGIGNFASSAGNYLQQTGNSMQRGLNNFADSSDQAAKSMYYSGARMYNNVTLPFRQAGAAVGGFGEGLVQGAKNIASIPGQIAALPGQAATAAGNAIQSGATAAGNAIQSGVDTARSYIPSVRSPFHYPGQPGQPAQPAGAM